MKKHEQDCCKDCKDGKECKTEVKKEYADKLRAAEKGKIVRK